jgi:hypothetical protein
MESGAGPTGQRLAKQARKDDNPTFKAASDEEFVRSFLSTRGPSSWVFSGIPPKRPRQPTAWRLSVVVCSAK